VHALPLRTATVLEIGAGSGILTEALADADFHVIAIEMDARLFRALRERLIGRTNVECHHGDFLRFALPRTAYSVVANLPFNITAAAVRRLLGAAPPPRDAFLVVQREAAQKFAGVPRETRFSLLAKPDFETRIVRVFRRIDFDPPPRARPALLHIRHRDVPLLESRSRARYARFMEAMFRGDRTVGTVLKRKLTYTQARRLARDHGFELAARTGSLTFPQWLAIFRFYEHVCLNRSSAVLRLSAFDDAAYNGARVASLAP
jgi:23S rRNA (adenine-N6)-dimethyltransferase